MEKRYGIITIGYNRIDSLRRLLDALNQAEYGTEKAILIISLDYADMPEIVKLAEDYSWEHGEKHVHAYTERQGLRQHILNCGDYIETYKLTAAAVFEDDVYPSPAYFNYMVQAVEFYGENENIAGISLYTHLWDEVYSRPFQPLLDRYDTFFMQYAQSWGQIWLPKQWKEFKNWYLNHSETFREAPGIPPAVAKWKDSSWLKYHIRYCVEKNKYFVYPRESLSTNFTEMGTHNKYKTALYQVPLQMDTKKRYEFAELETSQAVYDAFFENSRLAKGLGLSEEDVCVDLYGSKVEWTERKYWLTTKKADYKVVRTYGLALRPQELNVILKMQGEEIKLYDLQSNVKNDMKEMSMYQFFDYHYRLTHARWKDLVRFLGEKVKMKIQNRK